jgi:hypothetical protein
MMPTLHLCLLASLAGGSADLTPTLPAPAVAPAAAPTPSATSNAWAPSTPQDDAVQYTVFDHGVAIIGSKVVTRNDLLEVLQKPDYVQRQVDGEDMQAIFQDALRELTMAQLETDAGIAKGFPLDMINDRVDALLKQNQERLGGPHKLAKALEADGLTPMTFRTLLTNSALRLAWQSWANGQGVGPKGRLSVDRYIRPGMMAVTYDLSLMSPLEYQKDLIGKSPKRFVLRRLRLAPQVGQNFATQGEKLMRTARNIYDDIQSGASNFQGALVSFDLNQGRNGPLAAMSLDLLAEKALQIHGAEGTLTTFLRTAAVGDVSEPMVAYGSSGQGLAVDIYELSEVQPEQAPQPFQSLEIQENLKQHLLDLFDRGRLRPKQLTLLRTGHVFPASTKLYAQESLLRDN